MNLLEIKNLQMDFGAGVAAARAIDGVSLVIGVGETVCLVGESGCGKSVTAQSIARLVSSVPPANYVGGEILLNEVRDTLKNVALESDPARASAAAWSDMHFQDPGAALNPVFRIGAQIKEFCSNCIARKKSQRRRGHCACSKLVSIPRAGIAHPKLSF